MMQQTALKVQTSACEEVVSLEGRWYPGIPLYFRMTRIIING